MISDLIDKWLEESCDDSESEVEVCGNSDRYLRASLHETRSELKPV